MGSSSGNCRWHGHRPWPSLHSFLHSSPPPLVPFALDLDGNLTGPGLVRKVALELPGRQPRGISYRRDTWGAVWNNSAMSRCIGFLKFIARLGDWERR